MTVDPFHLTETTIGSFRTVLDQVTDFSEESGAVSALVFDQMHSTYTPLRHFKTMRLLAMHLWILTSRKPLVTKDLSAEFIEGTTALSAAAQIEPDIARLENRLTELQNLSEQTKPIKQEIQQVKARLRTLRTKLNRTKRNVEYPSTESDFIASLQNSPCPNLDALCRALALMDRATSRDVAPFSPKGTSTTSPVRAEMVQNLSHVWDMTDPTSPTMGDNTILGTAFLDPALPDSYAEHFVLMPFLVPYKNGVRMKDMEPIPLLWTTNPKEDPHGYTTPPTSKGVETLVQSTASYISVKPRGMDRGSTPQWKYAIMMVPTAKGPVQLNPGNPALHAFNPGGSMSPFGMAAGLWHLNRLTAAAVGVRLPAENMDSPDGLFWGADLPLISRSMGWSAERAVAIHDTLHRPMEIGTKRRSWSAQTEPTTEMLASPHASTATHLIHAFTLRAPEMGKWGALVSGMLYLPLAWRSGYLSAVPGQALTQAMTMGSLNRPTHELLQSVRNKAGKNKRITVGAHTRKGRTRHASSYKVSSFNRKPRPSPVCDLDIIGAIPFLRTEALAKRDISAARDMLAPLIAECLCKLIAEAEAGTHGTAARSWVRTAMDTAGIDSPEKFTSSLTNYMRGRAQAKGDASTYAGTQVNGFD